MTVRDPDFDYDGALYDLYVACGMDTDGMSAEEMAGAWVGWPGACVKAILDSIAEDRDEAERVYDVVLAAKRQFTGYLGRVTGYTNPQDVIDILNRA